MSVWKPSVTVAAVIERNGKFLFVQERISGGHLVLNQPAGHLDPGESLAAACRREVLEETAHGFEPRALVGIYRWRDPKRDFTFLRFAFRGTLEGTEKRPLDNEIVAIHWLICEAQESVFVIQRVNTGASFGLEVKPMRQPVIAQVLDAPSEMMVRSYIPGTCAMEKNSLSNTSRE